MTNSIIEATAQNDITGWLIILVPDVDLNESRLAQLAWHLAGRAVVDVLLITYVNGWAREPACRLRFSLIAVFLTGTGAKIETNNELTYDWIQVIHSLFRAGDLIVCHAEQKIFIAPGVTSERNALSKMRLAEDADLQSGRLSHSASGASLQKLGGCISA